MFWGFINKKYTAVNQEIRAKNLILPSNFFYHLQNFPLDKNISIIKFITEKTIGIHYWEVSWIKKYNNKDN